MKTIIKSIVSALCFMCMAACGQGDPKAEVTAFANRFASYVAQNQLDSIRAVYPDAAECDSFALNFVADSMRVEANEQAGTFTVSVGNGKDFVIAKDKDGKPAILHSLAAGLAGRTDEERICGFLHDVMVDTGWTAGDIREKGFPERIVNTLVGFEQS